MKKFILLFCLLATMTFGQDVLWHSNNLSFKPCTSGNITTYANSHCSQLSVNYSFPVLGDFFLSNGNVKILPSDVTLRPDPNGPYTILVSSPKFNVKAGQTVNIVLSFNVQGATQVNAWTHGCSTTHDGSVANSQIVDVVPVLKVTSGCSSSNNNPEPQAGGRYKAQSGYVPEQVVIHLDSGKKGTASIRSLGTHFHP